MSDYGLFKVPPQFDQPHFIPKGPIVYDARTGRVAGHMEKVAHFSRSALESINLVGSISSVINLGVSVATFAYLRSAFERTEKALSGVADSIGSLDRKVDSLHRAADAIQDGVEQTICGLAQLGRNTEEKWRTEVFAEIGAVLDVLTYADGVPEQEARQMVMANLVPMKKAQRLYGAFLASATVGASSEQIADLLYLEFLASLLEVRTAIVLGQFEQARASALAFLRRAEATASKVALEWRPQALKALAASEDPSGLVHSFAKLSGESVDSILQQMNDKSRPESWGEVNQYIKERWSFISDLSRLLKFEIDFAARVFLTDVPLEKKWRLHKNELPEDVRGIANPSDFFYPPKFSPPPGTLLKKGDEVSIGPFLTAKIHMPCDGMCLGILGRAIHYIEIDMLPQPFEADVGFPPVDRLNRILSSARGVASEVALVTESSGCLKAIREAVGEPFGTDFVLAPVVELEPDHTPRP